MKKQISTTGLNIMKKSVITFTCVLLGLFSNTTNAQIISIAPGTDFSIGSGTIVSADSLDITPSANFILNGCSMAKSNVVNNSTSIPYIKNVYQFSNTTNAFSGALKMFYSNASLNGLTESGLKFLIHNGASWSLDNNSSVNTTNKFVQNNAVNGVTLKELTAATCTPTSSIDTKTACGSYIWHGTTYTASNNTATWTGTNAAGCDSVVTLNLTIIPLPTTPIVNVVNNCNFTSTLSTTASGTLLWSTTETASSIIVSNAGIYTVTQTVNGCASEAGSGTAAPKATPATPTVNVVNNCNGTSTLSTTATGTLLWSTGTTTSSIVVNSAGTYTVMQTVDGCTSSAGLGTAAPKTAPAAPIVNVVNNCNSTSTLSTTASGTLLWSTGATTSSIIVSSAGTYTVRQMVNGCLSEAGSGLAAPQTSNTNTTTAAACDSYSWSVNNQTYTTSGTYSFVNGCQTEILNLTILPSPSVTITSNQSSICAGTAINFTATPTNGGTNPIYQWKLNGNNVGTNSNTYTNSNLSSTDLVTVEMTPNSNVSDDVTIGSQVWTSKNIEVTTYRNGDPITQVTNPTQWLGMTTGAYCYLNYDSVNNAKYGKLYNWYAVNDSRGLAPLGYHIPSSAEVDTFMLSVDNNAKSIMSTSGWVDFSGNDASGTNISGFNALPSGGHGSGGNGYFENMMGIFWASEGSGNNAVYYGCFSWEPIIDKFWEEKRNGYPVRLIKDSALENSNFCSETVTSNAINITVLPSASVTITSNQSSICAGTPVTFTASPTNGGTNPIYQWKLNGNNVGTNSNTYTNSNLSSTDLVTVEMTPDSPVVNVTNIGTQIWTNKNLDVSTYRNGAPITKVTNATQWLEMTTGAYCYLNYDSVNNAKYGKLYNWFAVNDSRGLAPLGYHIPSSAEVDTFMLSVDNNSKSIMSTSGWVDFSGNDASGTNISGFNALPTGGHGSGGNGYFENMMGIFWASEGSGNNAVYYGCFSWEPIIDKFWEEKRNGYPVRLIKDSAVENSNICSETVTSNAINITVNQCNTTLNVKVYLEGFYRGNGTMTSTLYDIGNSDDPTATDTITVSLWSPASLANASPNYSVNTILHTNGTASVQFPGATLGNSYYVAIKHRNSIETWSAAPITILSDGSYDFSTSLNDVYNDGFNDPMKSVSGGKYALYAGDVNQDGSIDVFDSQITENGTTGLFFGYDSSDSNGDGLIDLFDLQLIENNGTLLIFTSRPYL